ncbi:Sporulation protein YtfJ [Desulforamulus profundi]|uniref:Sporulation protein YtfJ n=1 Tax=Desulforamulus profundi TaxID=1383067 RepID=A0A2C6MID6_9FIRM|nr:spore germination protein GerW family protein [Desulforamulus profundi]PHJ39555.1 Sporulation protein YtfJ [Desulforamulus profundi]
MSRLENLISNKTIVGEPIISGNTTIIPLVTATVGVGIKLTPSALLIMQGDDVQVYSLSQKGNLAKLVEMIPDVISKLKLQEKDEQTSE